jgi:hypothetical protein
MRVHPGLHCKTSYTGNTAGLRLASRKSGQLLPSWQAVAPAATVPCAHMEGADDILTPEEGTIEEPAALPTRVALHEVGCT